MKICPKCNTQHNKPGTYCCRSCANSRKFTDETRLLKSRANKEFFASDRFVPKVKIKSVMSCIVCGQEYYTNRKTCSIVCTNYLRSVNRHRVIKDSKWESKRTIFKYGDFIVECDSKLEQTAVIFMVNTMNITKIERFHNLINYWENNSHRTFNPDFWTIIDNIPTIVEVKMEWKGSPDHYYGRTVPYKREALQKYCNSENINYLWLDTSNIEFNKLYYKVLKQK
jgi:hypothetical protein